MPDFRLKLNNGVQMPLVGHGLWKIPNAKIADHIYNSIKAGYRLFDGAAGEQYVNRLHQDVTDVA